MEVFPGPLPDGRRSGGDEGLGSRLDCLQARSVSKAAWLVKVHSQYGWLKCTVHVQNLGGD